MDRRSLLAALAAFATAPAAVAFAEARADDFPAEPILLADAFVLLAPYLELDRKARDRFSLAYCAQRDRLPTADVKALIRLQNGATRPLMLGPDGVVTRLPTLAELQSDAELEIDGAPFQFELEVRAILPPATRLAVADLTAALAQAGAGLTAITGQDTRLTAAYFPDAGAAHVAMPGGPPLPLPTFDFKSVGATAYFEPAGAPGASEITLARAPSRIILARSPRADG